MIYDCEVCKRTLVTHADEALEDGSFPPVVSYVAVLDTFYCCADCEYDHRGPGKFQCCQSSRAELGKALMLYVWMGDVSFEDDRMTNEGWGYCSRIGRFLVTEDTSGFVEVTEHDNDAKAEEEFQRWYSDGWGADEDDAYIAEDGSLWFGGKRLDIYPAKNGETSETRYRARVRIEATKQGFYPNLWRDNGRGNLSLLSY